MVPRVAAVTAMLPIMPDLTAHMADAALWSGLEAPSISSHPPLKAHRRALYMRYANYMLEHGPISVPANTDAWILANEERLAIALRRP